MRYIVFDLETQNAFEDVTSYNAADLDISVGSLYDSETDSYTTVVVDEIDKFWPIIEHADVLVGYNSNHFDIPLLNKYYPGDLTQIRSIDLLEAIRNSLGRRIRLDSVAQATIGAKKSANGLQALRWWKDGEIEKIKKYCQQDVKVTKEIFEYALEHGHVKYKDGHRKREIPLDTSTWRTENGEKTALTHSMGF